MIKYLMILCLALNISTTVNAGAIKALGDLMYEKGIVKIVEKYGIIGDDALKVGSYVNSALISFGANKNVSKQDLQAIIARLPITGEDAKIRKELQILLDKPESAMKKEDVINMVDNLLILADRHGKGFIRLCSECRNESLAKHGFKFSALLVKDSSMQKLLADVIPSNSKDRFTYIAAQMKKLGFGDYTKVAPGLVAPEEEKLLALFLGLAESGRADQKALIDAVKNVSTRNGQTNLLDPKNPHKFWKLVTEEMALADETNMTKLLNEVADLERKENITTEKAFYRKVEEKTRGDGYLMKQYQEMKARRCFFK